MEMWLKTGETLEDLQFRGLQIIQKRDSFRFGTDAILLADFAAQFARGRVADLGTGSGVIALLMAGRTETCTIDAVEIIPAVADMARRSVEMNHLQERIFVHSLDLRNAPEHLPCGRYSLVTCNPPYGRKDASIECADETERIARYERETTIGDVCEAAGRLLKHSGRFAVVFPALRVQELFQAMAHSHMEPKRLRTVHACAGKAPKIILVEAIKGAKPGLHWLEPLILQEADGRESAEIRRIYHKE